MATFGELRDEIAKLLKQTNNGLLTTEIEQAINDAIDFHATRRYDFNDGFDSFATVANQAVYPLPADFKAITLARIDWGNLNFEEMTKRSWQWYLRATSGGFNLTATPPTDYAIRQQKLYLFPTPPSAFTVELYYIAQLQPFPFTQADDQNAWTNAARLVIRSRALYDLYLNKSQQAEHAAAQLQFEQDALRTLTRPAALNLGAQRLEAWCF